MRFSTFTIGLACLASALVAAQTPALPSQDDFYIEPSNISYYEPGEVIRGRYIGNQLQGYVQGTNVSVKSMHQYMYRTTDSLGAPVAAVMTYIVPNKPKNWKLLAYSVAYDAANNDCSTSYSLQPNANNSVAGEILFIQAALERGWHVVTSDYEGLEAQFAAGIMSGHGVLDSIRASFDPITLKDTSLLPTAKYAMFGYSGGSLASEWAAELAPSYAPDLDRFVGAALGGLEPNLTNALITMNQGLPTGLMFTGTYGLGKAYPEFGRWISEQEVLPEKHAEFYDIASSCNAQNGPKGYFKDFFSYIVDGRGLLTDPFFTAVMATCGQMGTHAVPQMPLYVFKAVVDEVSPVGDTDDLVNKFCAEGVTVKYWRNLVGEHVANSFIGLPAAYQWLEDRFDGVPIALSQRTSCDVSTNNVPNVTVAGGLSILGIDLTNTMEQALAAAKAAESAPGPTSQSTR